MPFLLEIITPQRSAFSEEVDAVYTPTADGTIGILPHHMPLFTALSEGEVKIKSGNTDYYLAIGGGFMEVTSEKVSLLVSRAVHAHELNEEEIQKAQAAARELLTNRPKDADLRTAMSMLQRSTIELGVVRHHRTRSSLRH